MRYFAIGRPPPDMTRKRLGRPGYLSHVVSVSSEADVMSLAGRWPADLVLHDLEKRECELRLF